MATIKAKTNDKTLTLFISGRVDSSNASELEEDCTSFLDTNPHENLILDLDGLEYISSAGLRVVLRLRKSTDNVRIINASPEVYDIFDMTGFVELMPIEKAYRKLSVEGCPVIGKGAKGTVYRWKNDAIVKVYHHSDSLPEIHNERKLARKAFVLGIPTAISYDVVRVGESYGSVFELLDAKSFSQKIAEEPEKTDYYVKEYAMLLKQIHSTMVQKDDMPDIKETVQKWIDVSASVLPGNIIVKIMQMVNAVPDTLNMLHCDYHTNNLMWQNGEALLIDMDTLAHGYPIFELANIYITYVGFGEVDPSIVENFLSLPYETAVIIWKKFLSIYLDTTDPARLEEVENKARLLSNIRQLRHRIRRGETDTEEGRQAIEYCKNQVIELCERVDCLTF